MKRMKNMKGKPYTSFFMNFMCFMVQTDKPLSSPCA
jgi:hypothetical protein